MQGIEFKHCTHLKLFTAVCSQWGLVDLEEEPRDLPPHPVEATPSFLVPNPPWGRAHSPQLTWTCCFCAFSMFGSMERGPSTLIMSSFSISQGRSCASAAWKLASWFADSSSFCCRSAVAWLARSHLQSEAAAALVLVVLPSTEKVFQPPRGSPDTGNLLSISSVALFTLHLISRYPFLMATWS